jgi:hypothetical protein
MLRTTYQERLTGDEKKSTTGNLKLVPSEAEGSEIIYAS